MAGMQPMCGRKVGGPRSPAGVGGEKTSVRDVVSRAIPAFRTSEEGEVDRAVAQFGVDRRDTKPFGQVSWYCACGRGRGAVGTTTQGPATGHRD